MQEAQERQAVVEAGLALLTKQAGMKLTLTQKVHSCLGYIVVEMTHDNAANDVLFDTKDKSACLELSFRQAIDVQKRNWLATYFNIPPTQVHCVICICLNCSWHKWHAH